MANTTTDTTSKARGEGATTKRRVLPGAGLVRKAGLGIATGMLALGLFVGAGGASAAPLDVATAHPAPIAQAATADAAYYYNPTIAVPTYVAAGESIAIGGAGFDAYDAVAIYLVDEYGETVSSGTAYTDYYGEISGVLHAPYATPGAYTVVAVDSYGSIVGVDLWLTY